MGEFIPFKFETIESGCFVCVSHLPNKDGYIRVKNPIQNCTRLIMLHRLIWLIHNKEIPEKHEIDHLCGNRKCCNINHLQCISREEHLYRTNKSRYSNRIGHAHEVWMDLDRTKDHKVLAEALNIPKSTAKRWIKSWDNMPWVYY